MKLCAWQDPNLYAFRHQILSLARLPISPQAQRMGGRTLPYQALAFKIKQEFLPLTRLWEAPVVRTHRKVSCPVGCLLSGGIFHSWADVWFPKGTFTPD